MKKKKFADKETFEQNLDRRQVVGVFKRPLSSIGSMVHVDKTRLVEEGKSLWLRHNSALMKESQEAYFPLENNEDYGR